jgi:PAS domain S-box-containing protein
MIRQPRAGHPPARRGTQDRRSRLAAIAEHSFEAMIVSGPDGRIEAWNPGAARTFGFSSEEAIGRSLDSLIPSGYRDHFSRLLADALEGRGSGLFRTLGQHKEGGLIDISVSLSPLTGVEPGAGMVARDVSDLRRAEEEETRAKNELLQRETALRQALAALRSSHEELKQAQLRLVQAAKLESVGRLAAGVAHEVKNPLAVILAGTEYLLSEPAVATPAVMPILQDIRTAVGRANAVIMGLLNYSAATELSPSEADVNDVVERSLLMVQHALKRGHVTVKTELAPRLPKLQLDVNKIEQVIINLLINAIDATPPRGSVTIRTRRKQLTASDESAGFRGSDALRVGDSVILIGIADTGTGIPADHLNKVFDPFFTTKPTGKGTGLGLAVSKTIVALHGGTIWISNRPEGGALVTVVLRSATSERRAS